MEFTWLVGAALVIAAIIGFALAGDSDGTGSD